FRFDDRVAVRLILVALGDLVIADDLAAFLAALVVADRALVLAVELVKLNLLGRLDSVVDADRNSYQQESDVAFPDGSHCGYLLGAQAFACFKRESGVSASVFQPVSFRLFHRLSGRCWGVLCGPTLVK